MEAYGSTQRETQPFISVSGISFQYASNATSIFEDFSWHIERGENWSILGPSGCGKSTLLMLLAGLERPGTGFVSIDNVKLTTPRPNTGVVLQHYGLLPWATVKENISLGLRIRRYYGPDGRHAPQGERLTPQKIASVTHYWLERLGLYDVAHAFPGRISGGQRQRTAIARTLALQPDLLLLDEPFSALDAPTREQLQDLTLDLCAENAITAILVTHNIEEAAYVGHHILVLNKLPNTNATIIHNPHQATSTYRGAQKYHTICINLREVLNAEG